MEIRVEKDVLSGEFLRFFLLRYREFMYLCLFIAKRKLNT